MPRALVSCGLRPGAILRANPAAFQRRLPTASGAATARADIRSRARPTRARRPRPVHETRRGLCDIESTDELRYRNSISRGAQCPLRASRPTKGMSVSSRDLMAGFVRLHVLNHANAGPIFGIGIIERLAFHGYVLSPGTLYPILHGLERDGFLSSREEITRNRRRVIYEITDTGRRVLVLSRVRLWELFKEVFEKELSPDT